MKHPHHVQFEFWITHEASAAINEAAEQQDIPRGKYIQNAVWEALGHEGDRTKLVPVFNGLNHRFIRYDHHQPGYKGRWAMWVRGRTTVHRSVPYLLTRAASAQGFGSATALVRHHLVVAIQRDLHRTVVMPKGRSGAQFGGVIHEEVT